MTSSPGPEPARKRRKIRKGTTSCWECKRRKVRCSLVDSPPTAVCTACERRGTKCVTQDVQDESDNGERANIVYSNEESHQHPTVPSTRTVTDSALPRHRGAQTSISQELYDCLPSRKEIGILCKVENNVSMSFSTFITNPYPDIEKDGLDQTSTLLDIPTLESHPVLLARYIFRITMVLQSLDFKTSGRQLAALSEVPQLMTKRLAETAIRLVTRHDELLRTAEGLQCVMMEGSYQANCGNFCAAWVAFRKAMSLAQVMGIHRPGRSSLRFLDPRQKVDPSFLWYRIVHTDRFMCLMMGLPQGSMDRSMATERSLAVDTPLGRLERLHCVIASRILERNDADPASYLVDSIRDIDCELQKAAEMMPTGWWVVPDWAGHPGTDNDQEHPTVDWNLLRLVTQLYHYGLINQLHIPFMLRFTNANAELLHNYSQTACLNASREVLSRYIALRGSNRVAYCCRVLDFFSLSSAFLLLVSHLRQHARNPGELNFIAHQRQGDRAMVRQAVDNLQNVAWVSQDRIIGNSADLLSRLLNVEDEAAKGRIYSTHSIGSPDEVSQETDQGPPPSAKGIRFCIPYFGFVRIVPDGAISKEIPRETAPTHYPSSAGTTGPLRTPESGEIMAGTDMVQFLPESHGSQHGRLDILSGSDNGPDSSANPQQPWYPYNGFAPGADEWTLQDLDMTFFDSLIQAPATTSGL